MDEGEGVFVEGIVGDDAGFERVGLGGGSRGARVGVGGVVVFGGLAAGEGDNGGDEGGCDEE
jgi:hypothetical protein